MNTLHAPNSQVVRPAVCAGRFYSSDPDDLRAELAAYLASAEIHSTKWPKAIIAPHAGYVYSGGVAASAYAHLALGRHVIRRVVLIGPSHYEAFWGIAASNADAFSSPLGLVQVDKEAMRDLESQPQVQYLESPHQFEHSLEVQLPFLQSVLDDFTIIPLLVGDTSDEEVAGVLNFLWGGEETCIVISSDLSHHNAFEAAQKLDLATSKAIESLRGQEIRGQHACGWLAIRGMLRAARAKKLCCRGVDLRNSGDTAGRRDRVVGYGAYLFAEE
jgi:AmmeMemoRadiSam system protein B